MLSLVHVPARADVVPPPGPATVMRIIDGDTLRVRLPGGKRARTVRLRDVDAPEIKAKCLSEIALAQMAKSELERLAPVGSTVLLSATKGDKYQNRIDAKVAGPYGDMSEALLAAGLARPYNGGKRQSWC
ncbi:MAG: nuclease [Planctomycetes bacterium]|nr:nuclease [Planctomycetota bacterium]